MKKRGIWAVVSVLVVLSLILASCAKAPEAPAAPAAEKPAAAPLEVIKVQSQTFARQAQQPERWPLYPGADMSYDWGDFIEKMTGGRLEIDFAPADSIILWNEALPGVSAGTVDMIPDALQGTMEGLLPEAGVLNGLPLAWFDPAEVYDAFWQYGLVAEVQPLFHDMKVHIIPYSSGGFNVIMIKGDATNLDFIKGKKIRAVGAMNQLIPKLGGYATIIPYSEGYMALKLGTIDGWVADPSVALSFKFYETATPFTMVVYPRLGSWTNSTIWNLDFWNELPADIRETIETLTPMYVAWYANVRSQLRTRTIGSYMEGKGLLKTATWSEKDAKFAVDAAHELWDTNYASKSANMARLVALMKKQAAALGRPFPGDKAGW